MGAVVEPLAEVGNPTQPMEDHVQRQRSRWRENNRAWKRRNPLREARMAALDAYGCRCARCGFTDERALQFDHVNGGGNRELGGAKRRWSSYVYYYRHVLDELGSGKFQVLCANCNWIKRRENGEDERVTS